MTCPNLGHLTYKKIVEENGKHAAYVVSDLFDSIKFQEWKGDDEIPALVNGNVLSNTGSTFSITQYLTNFLENASAAIPQTTSLQFDLKNSLSEEYQLDNFGNLSFRTKSVITSKYQKPYKLGHVTEGYVRDIAERLKSKFGVDYKVINDGQKFWAGKFDLDEETGKHIATINLAYATEDTPFHEFAHPFIDTLQVTNARLFDKLSDEILAERDILMRTKQLYPELLGLDLIKEAMVQAIGQYASEDLKSPSLIQYIKELLEELSKYLGDLLNSRYLLPAELPPSLTLRHIGSLMNTNHIVPILTIEAIHYQKIQDIDEKRKVANPEQLKSLNILYENSNKVILDEGPHIYEDRNKIQYSATSEVIGSTWTGPKNTSTTAADMGTQAHQILQDVIEGREVRETNMIHATARQQLIDRFSKLKEELTKDGSILVAEAVVSDLGARIAGSVDLFRIKPNGKVDIYDLKTSGYYTSKANQFDNTNYDYKKTGLTNLKRSKRGDHAAQLSMYKGLAEGLGVMVEKMYIIPTKINTIPKGSIIISIEEEPIISVTPDMITTHNILSQYRKQFDNGQSTTQKDWTKMVDKFRVVLQSKIDRLNESQVGKSNQNRLKELKGLLRGLQNVDAAKEISIVIDTIHSELITGIDGKASYQDKFESIAQKIPFVLASGDQRQIATSIRNLNIYLDYVSDFNNIQDYIDMYADSMSSRIKPEPGSPLQKLQQIIDARDAIKSEYQRAVAPLMARNLAQLISPEAQASANQYLEKMQANTILRNEAISNNKPGQAARHQEIIDNAKKKFESVATSEDKIMFDLIDSRADMGVLEYLTSTMTNSSDTVLGLFAKKIKAVFHKIDLAMNTLQKEAVKEFEIFAKATKRNRDNPETFNKGLYETVTTYYKDKAGQWVAVEEKHFVNPTDTNRYNRAYKAMQDSAAKAEEDAELKYAGEKDEVKKSKLIRQAIGKVRSEWYKQNTVSLPQAEIDQILEEKREDLEKERIDQQEYQEWLEKNRRKDRTTGKFIYMNELSMPNPKLYNSSAFAAIQADPAMKRYYNYLTKLHFQAQAKYPDSKELGYKLPSVGKALEDTVREKGGWKHILPHFADTFLATTKDADRYGEHKVVPTYFLHPMPIGEISNDLLGSMLLFSQATSKYEAIVGTRDVVGLEQESIALMNIFREREISQTDSSGQKLVKDAAKKLGLSDPVIDKKGGYFAAFLEHFIDQNIYGVGEQKVLVTLPKKTINGVERGGQTIDVGKTINNFMMWFSVPALGGPFTILKALANKLNAEYNVILEAFAGQHFNAKAYLMGTKTYDNWMVKNMVKDFNSPIAISKEGQMMDKFSPMQGHFTDHFGKEITWSAGKKLMQPGSWFFLQNAGEHTTLNKMFFAIAHHTQVKTIDGQSISLVDAYELNKEGILQLKEGVLFSEDQENAFINKIHALNKQLHGIYNRMDKSVIQKHALGRLAMMYRKYLIPAVKRRWGGIKMDQEMGETVEGFHRTLVNTAINDFRSLVDFYLRKTTTLTPMEQANIRRATFELLSTIAFSIIIAAMIGYRKDHDKVKKADSLLGYTFNATLYEFMRMNSEIQAFIPGVGFDDALRTVTSPSAASGMITKLSRFAKQLLTNPFETYDQNNKYYKKGDSKLKKDMLSILGVGSSDPLKAQEQFSKLY